jgi:hypothetical protein
MCDLVARIWEADRATALEISARMTASHVTHYRAIGVSALARRASAAELDHVVRALHANQFPDERRFLVRALGSKPPDGALPVAWRFVRDNDPMVQVAAIAAMTDHKRLAVIGALIDRLPPPPSNESIRQTYGSDENYIMGVAMYGSVYALTGIRAKSSADVQGYWNRVKAQVNAQTPARAGSRIKSNPPDAGKGALQGANIDVRFVPAAVQSQVAQVRNLKSEQDWTEFVQELDRQISEARSAAADALGIVYLPSIELRFMDARAVAAADHGTSQGMGAYASGTRIGWEASQLNRPDWQAVMRHEWVHVMHGHQYPRQPRWLAEGLACSLTESPRATMWSPKQIAGRRIAANIDKGAAIVAIAWKQAGASQRTHEGPLYSTSHLVVDYLRFGGVTEPEVRLRSLMGHLSRGENETTAIKAVYGMSIEELDRRIAAWARQLPEQEDQPPANR